MGGKPPDRTEEAKNFKTIRLTVQEGLCAGCRICELACSLTQGDVIDPRQSKIQVRIKENGEVELEIPPECSCRGEEPVCVELCPTGALEALKED